MTYYISDLKLRSLRRKDHKTGKKDYYFKTIITVDFAIPAHFIKDNIDEDKLRERIKMLMVFK